MKEAKLTKTIGSLLVVASVLILNTIEANAEWKHDSNGWWYTESNVWSVGWKEIDGKWYYFNSDGYMAHNAIINGYKLGSDGAWIEPTQNMYKELDKLPKKYKADDAQKNGDVVQILGGIKYNIEKLDKFIEDYKNKKANVGDMVRIVMYGEDGGPRIIDLTINSEGSIKLKEDNTRDWLSSDKDRIITEYKVVDIYTIDNTSGYRTYYVKTDQGTEKFLGNSNIY